MAGIDVSGDAVDGETVGDVGDIVGCLLGNDGWKDGNFVEGIRVGFTVALVGTLLLLDGLTVIGWIVVGRADGRMVTEGEDDVGEYVGDDGNSVGMMLGEEG
jgi:hypothetical protein